MNLPGEKMLLEVEQTGVDFIPGRGHKCPGPDKEAYLMDQRPSTFDEVPSFDFIPVSEGLSKATYHLTCPVCRKKTKNRGALMSHMRIHHNESH